jgi:hypothetical protein
MKKHRAKIIFAGVAICALAAAWVFGGNYANREGEAGTSAALDRTISTEDVHASAPTESASAAQQEERAESQDARRLAAVSEGAESFSPPAEIAGEPAQESAPSARAQAQGPDASKGADRPAAENAEGAETPAEEPGAVSAPAPDIDPETGKDKYRTDPVPEGKPLPAEPQDVTLGDDVHTATLTVRCDTILSNMTLLDKEKQELVPADGVILETTTVTFYEGESVFNVLQREMKRARIHMEFVNTPIYNSAYIEGISNLYAFDAGELSGWMYEVNGRYPNYGCSRYRLRDGDAVEWRYTCDLGRDLGVDWLGGRMMQRDE